MMDENGYLPGEPGYTPPYNGLTPNGTYSPTANPLDFWKQAITNTSFAPTITGYGEYEPDPNGISDPNMQSSLEKASTQAKALGDTNFAKILDFVLDKGDKALGILTKNGIIKNQNLLASQGFSNYGTNTDGSTWYGTNRTPTASAPKPETSGFNIDFTDPKTLIIIFLVLMGIFYFFFFSKTETTKNAKR